MNVESSTENSSKVIDFPASESIAAQAVRWIAALDVDRPSDDTLAAFREWINKDDAHLREFEAAAALWSELNILTQVTPPRASGVINARSRKSWWPAYLTTATAALALISFVFLNWMQAPQMMVYTTSVGEQQTITLPDQSTMLLNTDSRVSVNYTDTHRGITLERGEALFEVAHNPQKPFEVRVGERIVRAVGTAFSVYLQSDDIEVIVTEGVIEIENQAEQSAPVVSNPDSVVETLQPKSEEKVRVKAGNRALLSDEKDNEILIAEIKRIENEVSWRNGVLTFDREPLEKVVNEIARYTKTKFVVPEKDVREMIVGGVFKVGDTKSLFEALQLGFGIHVVQAEDNVIYLGRIEPASK